MTDENESFKNNSNSSKENNEDKQDNQININVNYDREPHFKKIENKPININLRKGLSVDSKLNPEYSDAYNRHAVQTEPNQNSSRRILSIGPRIVADNKLYLDILKKREENMNNKSYDIFKKKYRIFIKNEKKA